VELTRHFGRTRLFLIETPDGDCAGVEHASNRGSNVLARYRWGFQNFMDPKRLLVNAVAETVAEKRTFSKAFRETRCLVPATGFYDYRKSDPPGQKGLAYGSVSSRRMDSRK
jgi:putative SOS response-associated peptidase YedK